MTRRQKISLGLWLIAFLVILLSMIQASAQQYDINKMSVNGKKSVPVRGMIIVSDLEIVLITTNEKQSYPVKQTFKINGTEYREIAMMGCRMTVYILSTKYEDRAKRVWEEGTINIYKRYQRKPEEIIQYSFKRKL